jgi:simple sugar transport system ATP-binding protein
MKDIEKHFGSVIALAGVSVDIYPGECHCLLGDNGAGKSTFIKTMSGVHKPTKGEILFEGRPMHFENPRDAMDAGIATVHQDLAMIPLMSVSRNFFMGNEPKKRFGIPFFDHEEANRITMEEMRRMGINLRGPDQAVGTLSGGERQTVAISRAVHFGAKVLILDEPTSALGVRQTPTCWRPSTRCASRTSRLSSSPTMCAMRWPWATGSPCSTAVKRSAPRSAARSRRMSFRT